MGLIALAGIPLAMGLGVAIHGWLLAREDRDAQRALNESLDRTLSGV